MRIGFLGLGQMGRAMAANLLKAGHELTVWNRSPCADEALVAAGARRAVTPAEAAQGEIVLSMLANDAAVEAVVFGTDGIARSPALHVCHATIGIALADRLADTQAGGYVSAPVFGRPPAAEAAKLFVVAGGPEVLVDRCMPLFEVIGQRTFRVGETPSAANVVKLGGNFMIMAAVEAMAEAMTLAEKNGVDRAQMLEILTGTIFGAPVYANYGSILVEDRFRPAGFPAPLGLKDMTLVGEAAAHSRVPMPLLGVVRDHLIEAIVHEGEDIDWSGIALAVRRSAGVDS